REVLGLQLDGGRHLEAVLDEDDEGRPGEIHDGHAVEKRGKLHDADRREVEPEPPLPRLEDDERDERTDDHVDREEDEKEILAAGGDEERRRIPHEKHERERYRGDRRAYEKVQPRSPPAIDLRDSHGPKNIGHGKI